MPTEDKARHRRLEVLEKLLAEEVVCRQTVIVDRLTQMGFEVTQSSVSRDLAALGVGKEHGRYVVQARKVFTSVVSVTPAGPHMLVVRTTVGAAQLVAYQIDESEMEGVVGTVAGDDTIFVALARGEDQPRVMKALKEEL